MTATNAQVSIPMKERKKCQTAGTSGGESESKEPQNGVKV